MERSRISPPILKIKHIVSEYDEMTEKSRWLCEHCEINASISNKNKIPTGELLQMKVYNKLI